MTTPGDQIYYRIEELGLNQRAVARLCGLSRVSLIRAMKNQNTNLETLRRIANGLDIDIIIHRSGKQ